MRNIGKLFLLFVISTTLLNAQEYNKVGTSVAQFLKIDSGARPTALAGAYAAIANDANALYWNVAGIAQLDKIETTFSYTNWIADLQHSYVGIVFPLSTYGTLGASIIALNSDPIEQTTIENPRGTGVMVDASDLAIGLSYARNMTDYLSVGVTIKYIQQTLWELQSRSFAFDAGFLLNTGFRGVKIGMVLSNFGTEMTLSGRNLTRSHDKWPENVADPNVSSALTTKSWPIPTSYRLSIALNILDQNNAFLENIKSNSLIMSLDAMHLNDNPEHFCIGFEYGFRDMFFIRTGYKGNTDERGMTAGGGVCIGLGGEIELAVDYAYADFGIFDDIQQFSVGISF